MKITSLEVFATVCMALAVLHTFGVKYLQKLPRAFHFLSEVELVFGIWGGLYLLGMVTLSGPGAAVTYLATQSFVEPAFVFVILIICSTRPILELAEWGVSKVSQLLPFDPRLSYLAVTLILAPLLGSFITEPAAMTLCALIMSDRFFSGPTRLTKKFMYAALGVLFVNISIGGILTTFAAPPVLMVAAKWNWDFLFMMRTFGWRAILSTLISTALLLLIFKREILNISWEPARASQESHVGGKDWAKIFLRAGHLLLLVLVVFFSHQWIVFSFVFLIFLALYWLTRSYQDKLRTRESFLVGVFLAGLVILGGPQRWWVEPILTHLDSVGLYLGAMGLTSITDNAALTYLGTLVPALSDSGKFALVAGSVVGGGLTVIANAPNPVGYSILNPSFIKAFGSEGISPLYLFAGALVPTFISACVFWL